MKLILCHLSLSLVFVLAYAVLLSCEQYGQVSKSNTGSRIGDRYDDPIECGTSTSISRPNKHSRRIVDGKEAKGGEFPWQVMLFVPDYNTGEMGQFQCSGSIIDEWHILTAAHCITGREDKDMDPSDITIVVGEHDRLVAEERKQFLPISGYVRHKRYHDCKSVANDDIALIRMAQKMTLKLTSGGFGSVNTVCLPDGNDHLGEECIISGWGLTKYGHNFKLSPYLQYANIAVQDYKTCVRDYNWTEQYYWLYRESILCGYKPRAKQTICSGDSGGPVVWRSAEGKSFLVGIISAGTTTVAGGTLDYCNGLNGPGIYTRVSYYLDWIKNSKLELAGPT